MSFKSLSSSFALQNSSLFPGLKLAMCANLSSKITNQDISTIILKDKSTIPTQPQTESQNITSQGLNDNEANIKVLNILINYISILNIEWEEKFKKYQKQVNKEILLLKNKINFLVSHNSCLKNKIVDIVGKIKLTFDENLKEEVEEKKIINQLLKENEFLRKKLQFSLFPISHKKEQSFDEMDLSHLRGINKKRNYSKKKVNNIINQEEQNQKKELPNNVSQHEILNVPLNDMIIEQKENRNSIEFKQ